MNGRENAVAPVRSWGELLNGKNGRQAEGEKISFLSAAGRPAKGRARNKRKAHKGLTKQKSWGDKGNLKSGWGGKTLNEAENTLFQFEKIKKSR